MIILKKHKAYLLVVYAFLLVLHFVLKDRFDVFSVLFYASPLILIIGFGWFVSYLYLKTKLFKTLLVSQILLSILWCNNNIFVNEVISNKNNDSVIFWNLAKNKKFPFSVIKRHVEKEEPLLIAFVEDKSIHSFVDKPLKNYKYKKLVDDMSILYLGELIDVKFYYKEVKYKFNVIKIRYNNKISSYLIADVWANPFVNKKEALKKIIEYSNQNHVDLILGDFNTPYESVFFEDFECNFKNFRSKSNGLTTTWFYGLPLLEIDQIWLNKEHQALLLEKFQYINSDHKLLIATYKTNIN